MEHYLKIFESTLKKNWSKTAVCNYQGECFTFSEMAEHIEKFHIFFEKAGIREHEHITLCAKNTARWAVSFFAINTYPAVVVSLLSDFTPDGICTLVDHSESTVLFVDTDIWEKLDITRMPRIKAVVSVNEFKLLYCSEDSICEAFDGTQSEFDARHPKGLKPDDVHYNIGDIKEIGVINYTSGTTSAPKGVILRSECISAICDFTLGAIPNDNSNKIVSMLPMGHIYGLVIEFMYSILSGSQVYFLGKTPSPTLLVKALQDVRPFIIITVPLVMEKIYKSSIKPILSKRLVKVLTHTPWISRIIYRKIGQKMMASFGGNVQHIIMGGAALNPEVERTLMKAGVPIFVGYGMTEAAPLLTFEYWYNFKAGSCGKPIPCCDIRIDSEDPQRIAGEIQAKGPNICSGYFNNPEASANAFTEDGYLHTGDLGIIDKNGNLFIKGRSKNMILSANGQNIYPEELEAVINNEPFISESVVVDRGGKLVALIVLDEALIKRRRLRKADIAAIPENARVNANLQLPTYSQIAKTEVMSEPFAKTPKMSIKRFLYK